VESNYVKSLKEFHRKFGHAVSDSPYIPSQRIMNLRIRLIDEEASETIEALQDNDLAEIADGLADLLYVVFGTAVSYGIPIDEIFNEVHRSNMTKSIDKDKGGKTIKGADWDPPRLKEILFR
jgi:predicted HAD superfamily Cof-like phosphohydrolase